MSVIKITNENFENEVLNHGSKVLVDFYADWCGPCRMLSPTIDEIAEERSDIKVCKINVDTSPEIASSLRIVSIPTVIIFENGEIKSRFSGVRDKEDILELL